MAAIMLIEDVHNIGQRAADKLMDQRFINREPQLSGACLPGLNPQTLGIDQRSIHVKNNSLDHIGPPRRIALLPLYRTLQACI